MAVKSPAEGIYPQPTLSDSCLVSPSSNVHLERRSSVETVVESIKPASSPGQTPTGSEDQSLKSPSLAASSNSAEETAFHIITRLNSCLSRSASQPTSFPTSHNNMSQQQQRFRPPLARRKAYASTSTKRCPLSFTCETSSRRFSTHFPEGHQLDAQFAEAYQLRDELGSGGYGFVMTALDRDDGLEVAVKFIIKDKIPEHCWIHDPTFGKLPMEVVLLSFVDHDSIVKCLDVFEDDVYFYLVQELHGSPWNRSHGFTLDCASGASTGESTASLSTPSLSPSTSETSLPSSPRTPPLSYPLLPDSFHDAASRSPTGDDEEFSIEHSMAKLQITKRPSYDLFECIEQSEQKRLTEEQARYVFAQVADAINYLDSLGIAHRDIKDENVVIDQNLKIKLIDFGSATIVDPTQPRPYYDLFYGTAAYASSEILLKRKYQAAPAEVWTLGVLLSYLLAGVSPFPTVRDAVDGRIFLSESLGLQPSANAMDLLRMCLDPNPRTRISIEGIMQHPWLHEDLSEHS